MAKIEVILPQMGEGIIEATITRWLVDVNSFVNEDDPIIEIATDKVDSEIPAPVSGKLIKQFFFEGEVSKVGDVVAIIEDASKNDIFIDSVVEFQRLEDSSILKEVAQPNIVEQEIITEPDILAYKDNVQNIPLFIRNFSSIRGISSYELGNIKGSGKEGLIVKNDIKDYIKLGRPFKNRVQKSFPDKSNDLLSDNYVLKEGEELVDLDRTRLLIAQHMVHSVLTAPHVTSFIEVDITSLVEWRESVKSDFNSKNGVSLTYTPIITDVVVRALKEYMGINVSLISNSKMLKKKYINIGIATALPDGNLIVPVIKHADKLNLYKLALDISDKTLRARKGLLKPEEIKGGTFTITNLGQVGNMSGTPIINQPESAILAVGAITKKPGVVKVNGDYAIGVRDMLTLSLSYDHRVIDGGLGGAFLSRIGRLLESYQP